MKEVNNNVDDGVEVMGCKNAVEGEVLTDDKDDGNKNDSLSHDLQELVIGLEECEAVMSFLEKKKHQYDTSIIPKYKSILTILKLDNCDLKKENIRLWYISQYLTSQYDILCETISSIEKELEESDEEEEEGEEEEEEEEEDNGSSNSD